MTNTKTVKVLVVDDSQAMTTIVRRGLQNMGVENLEVKTTYNGRSALELIKEWDPFLVVSDYHMPEMTGLELMQEMNRQMLDINIGFVTTENAENKISELIDSGAKFVVKKPFDFETLQHAVLPLLQGTLEGEEAVSDSQTSAGDTGRIAIPSAKSFHTILNRLSSSEALVEASDKHAFNQIQYPCLLGLYEDVDRGRVQAITLMDLPAAAIIGTTTQGLAVETGPLSKPQLQGCENFLSILGTSMYDNKHKQPLTLRSTSVIHEESQVITKLLGAETERTYLEVGAVGQSSGKVAIITT